MTPPDRAAMVRVMADGLHAVRNLPQIDVEPMVAGVLTALEAVGVVLMPVEPTDEMLRAGHTHVTAKGTYRAMVEHSPYRSGT